MTNTRADLDRLKAERWAVGPGGPRRPGAYVELLAMAERLMSDKEQLMLKLGAARMDTHQAIHERDESAQEVRYCHGMQIKADDLAAALLLEIGRLRAKLDVTELLRVDNGNRYLRAVACADNLRAELIERCELLERMAGPGPCFLAVSFSDHPGAGAIHFATDHDLIYGPEPEATNDEKPQEG